MIKTDKYIHYKAFAEVFKYPTETLPEKTALCMAIVKEHYPDSLDDFKKFADWVYKTPLYEMEEVYTKTFHIQAICYLDLGFVIFGEDYKRGEFLVNMKREQQEANNECGNELPDNLVNVLTLLPRLTDDTFRDELAVQIVIPALQKMLDEFKAARMELKTKVLRKKHKAILQEGQRNGNIYQYALRALMDIFNKDFGEVEYNKPVHELGVSTNGFATAATSCGSCSFISNKSTKTIKS